MDGFGKRLRELRMQHSLSQEALAQKLGVTAQAVSKWENGKSYPDFPIIVPMAQLFRVSTDQLMGNEGIRGDWELRWQRLMIAGKPEEARKVALEAQRDLRQARHFSYRQAESEVMMARKTEDRDKKRHLLSAAERRYREIVYEYPEFEGAAMGLVGVLLDQGRRQEAEDMARGYPNAPYILLQKLGDRATEEQKLLAVTARAMLFFSILCEPGDPWTLDLGERFLRDFPWDARDRAGLLSYLYVRRAMLLCKQGETDAAMAELLRLRELMHPVAPEEQASPTFQKVLPEAMAPREGWVYGLGQLRSPGLKALEDRPEFQELLALADQGAPKEQT